MTTSNRPSKPQASTRAWSKVGPGGQAARRGRDAGDGATAASTTRANARTEGRRWHWMLQLEPVPADLMAIAHARRLLPELGIEETPEQIIPAAHGYSQWVSMPIAEMAGKTPKGTGCRRGRQRCASSVDRWPARPRRLNAGGHRFDLLTRDFRDRLGRLLTCD